MLGRIIALSGKEIRHILRDPRTLAVIFLMPAFMVLIFGYALNMDIQKIGLAVIDQDMSPESRALIRSLESSDYFEIAVAPVNRTGAEALLRQKEIKGVLVIPNDYGEQRTTAPTARVQLIVDGSDPTYGQATVNYASAIAFNHSVNSAVADTAIPVEIRERFFFNPDLKGSDFIIPGVVAVILMMVSALLTSITIAREKETGTMDVLLVSPVRPVEIIVGKVIPYIGIAFIEALFILGFSHLVFQVPFRGSLLLLFGLTVVYIYCALAMGLLISSVASTQQVAMMAALVASILPSMILSGFVFSTFSMPYPIRILTNIVPARHYITIIRGILLKASTFAALRDETLMLLAIGTVFLTIATLKFNARKGE